MVPAALCHPSKLLFGSFDVTLPGIRTNQGEKRHQVSPITIMLVAVLRSFLHLNMNTATHRQQHHVRRWIVSLANTAPASSVGRHSSRIASRFAQRTTTSSAASIVEEETTERPRLQALREQLATERVHETEAVKVNNAVRPSLKSIIVNGNSNNNSNVAALGNSKCSSNIHHHDTALTSSSSSELPLSLQELIQRLRDEPLPNMMNMSSTTNPAAASLLLQDRFHRQHSYLRISLVERCNLRCTYCMPADGLSQLQPTSSLLQTPELLHLASLFTNLGVRKIRLTGGEPLLRKDLVDVIHGLSNNNNNNVPLDQLGMTTNGITLARQLPILVEAGLTHVNISLDTLQSDKFERITRRKGFDKVWQSIEAACDMYRSDMEEEEERRNVDNMIPSNNNNNHHHHRPKGLGRVKLNCVVMRGVNDDELADFCQLTLRYPMLDVRFIEWMPFSDNGWETNHLVPYQEMKQRLVMDKNSTESSYTLQRLVDGPNDTTKWYQWIEGGDNDETGSVIGQRLPDRGRIGFISSMTDHFCATCNRLRLTADGQFKVCLFGTHEVSLRDALRHGVPTEDLQRIIAHAVWNKHWALGGHDSALQLQQHAHDNRPMVLIGG
jgi:cyclic pyranopterin phosphate synthase